MDTSQDIQVEYQAWQVKLKKKKKRKMKKERSKEKLKLAADTPEADKSEAQLGEKKTKKKKKKKRRSKQKAGSMEEQQADDWEGVSWRDKEKVTRHKGSKRKITQTDKQKNKKRKRTLTTVEPTEHAQVALAAQIQGQNIGQSDMTVRRNKSRRTKTQKTDKRKEKLMDGKRICSLCCQEIAVDKVNSVNIPTDPTIYLEQSGGINELVGSPGDSQDSSDIELIYIEQPEDITIELFDDETETMDAQIEIHDSDNEITELEDPDTELVDCGIKKASVHSNVETALGQNGEQHGTTDCEAHNMNNSEATIQYRDVEMTDEQSTPKVSVELQDSDPKLTAETTMQEDDDNGTDDGTGRPLCDQTTQTVCDQMTCQSGLRCGNCQTKGHIRKNSQCPSYNTRDEMERRVACKEVARKRELRGLLVRIREVADAQTDERERLEILQMQETVMSAEMGFQRSIGQVKQIIQKLDQWAWAWGRTGNLSPSEVKSKVAKKQQRKKYYPSVV